MADLRRFDITTDISVNADERTLEWWGGESVTITGKVRSGQTLAELPSGGSCLMHVWSGAVLDPLYINQSGGIDTSGSTFEINITDDDANLAPGSYNGAIWVVSSDGEIAAVIWRGAVVVASVPARSGVSVVGGVSQFSVTGASDVDDTDKADDRILKWDATAGKHVYVDETGGGVTDHGALTGLGDDDHPQYHTDARGDARYTPIAHASSTANPHSVTKAQVGLGSADNTSDVDKPVSTAQQAALDAKENALTPASQVEMEAGTEAALRSMSPQRVAQAIAALAGSSGSVAPATFTGSQLEWDSSNANPTGNVGSFAKQITSPINCTMRGIICYDATMHDATLDVTIPGPVAAALATSDTLRLMYMASINDGTYAKLDLTVFGLNADMDTETSVHSATAIVPAASAIPEVLKVAKASFTGSDAVFPWYTFRHKFYAKANGATPHWFVVGLGGLWA